MGFREWYKKQKEWTKYSLIGMLIGLFIYLISFSFSSSESGKFFWSLGPILFCNTFNLLGEDCAFVFIIYGWLFLIVLYGLIGLSLGFIIGKIRK